VAAIALQSGWCQPPEAEGSRADQFNWLDAINDDNSGSSGNVVSP
jgi:hypothetical protein